MSRGCNPPSHVLPVAFRRGGNLGRLLCLFRERLGFHLGQVLIEPFGDEQFVAQLRIVVMGVCPEVGQDLLVRRVQESRVGRREAIAPTERKLDRVR